MEEQLIIDIWETFKDYIPEKSRSTSADQYIDLLVGKDVDIEVFEGLLGYDPHLDTAIEMVLEAHQEVDDDIDTDDDDDIDTEDY